MAIYSRIKRMRIKFNADVDPRIRRLVTGILRVDPKRRLSVNKILTAKVFIPYLVKFNEPHLIVDPLERRRLTAGCSPELAAKKARGPARDDLLAAKDKSQGVKAALRRRFKSKSPHVGRPGATKRTQKKAASPKGKVPGSLLLGKTSKKANFSFSMKKAAAPPSRREQAQQPKALWKQSLLGRRRLRGKEPSERTKEARKSSQREANPGALPTKAKGALGAKPKKVA